MPCISGAGFGKRERTYKENEKKISRLAAIIVISTMVAGNACAAGGSATGVVLASSEADLSKKAMYQGLRTRFAIT